MIVNDGDSKKLGKKTRGNNCVLLKRLHVLSGGVGANINMAYSLLATFPFFVDNSTV